MKVTRTFLLPLAALLFVFALVPQAARAATADCPPEPATNTPIADGEVLTGANCTLKTSGDVDSFVFTGNKGETYQLAVALDLTATENVCMTLYDPKLNNIYSSCAGYPSYATTTDQTLAMTGTYTIDITEPSTGTQNYALSLQRLYPFPPNVQAIKLATVYAGDIAVLTQANLFTFYAATTGEYQAEVAIPGSATAKVCLTIYSPSGALITPTTGTEGGCAGYPSFTTAIAFTPTVTGTYMAFVAAQNNDGTQTYNLELSCVVGNCPTGTPPPSCTLTDTLAYDAATSTVTMNFTVGNTYATTWNAWLVYQNAAPVKLFSAAQAVTVPPANIVKTATLSPKKGEVGVLSTLTTSTRGIACSNFAKVATGTP